MPNQLNRLAESALPPALGRNRIVSVCSERMTPEDSPQPQQRSLDQPVNLQRLNHVVRTAGLEPAAAAHHRAQDDLIGAYEQDQRFREKTHFISSITSPHFLSRRSRRPMKIHSVCSGASPPLTSRPNASRIRRLARLRSTASWKDFLETTTPAIRSASGDEYRHATRRRPLTERPRSKTRLYFVPGSRVDICGLRPASGACGPSHDETREPCVRPWSPCARDNRFSFSA